ncbi:MAG: phenylalanine--tRNA ligase subunit beta [Chloracidobacterium sp.]|nr:phenylalanine--tRNA ligase subunit beta [Chloracidobacterium sp.]MDW8216345.1 phenylalanine--tRNA ligase subunit beta [Acidobacteriota bacterium]
MKVSYNWLETYVKPNLAARELAERFTAAGLAVDAVTPYEDDFIFDFDLTTNRPDALCHFGLAREAAVLTGAQLTFPEIHLVERAEPIGPAVQIEVEAPHLCHRYAARIIQGVKVGPSPDWLVRRLAAVGQRSINNIVDATNFVLLELGHPLHAFDFERLIGRRIVVRCARSGETITTLDGVRRELSPDMLVICDAERPVAVAGVMGGADSEISAATTQVLLESAWFAPAAVRRTARALGLHTEASRRFERGADVENVRRALDRCAQIIVDVAGGEVLGGPLDVVAVPRTPTTVRLRHARIAELTGVEVPPSKAAEILTGLGFELVTEEEGETEWIVPSFRVDVAIEEDLVEEVVRHVGYDAVPATLPGWDGAGEYLPGDERRRVIRQTLLAHGFYEAISFSWCAGDLLAAVGAPRGMLIANPLDQQEAELRTSLLPGLLTAVARNFRFGTDDIRLFEIGKVFHTADGKLVEAEHLALAMSGRSLPDDWRGRPSLENFHTLKGIVEALCDAAGCRHTTVVVPADEQNAIGLFPGQAGVLRINDKPIGRLGRLGSAVAAHFDFKSPVYVAEIELAALLSDQRGFAVYRPLPRYPRVERDISALFDAVLPFAAIQQAVLDLRIEELEQVRLRDVFTGAQIPPGKRAVTLNLWYRAADRTLTDDEVAERHRRVVETLCSRFGATIR